MDFVKRNQEAAEILARQLVEARAENERLRAWSSRASEALSWLADVDPELVEQAIAKFNLEAHG